MADLRTNPNLNRMQIDKAFESLRNRPNLGRSFADTPIDIRLGDVRGRGFGETYLPGEAGPPNNPAPGDPNKLRIELRQSRFDDIRGKRDFILGELLHQMGSVDLEGKPFNEKFFRLKEKLISSLTPEQLEEERYFYNRDKREHGGTNFQDFPTYMMTTRGDGLIRSDILPQGLIYEEERDRYLRRDGTGHFTKDQIKI